MLESIQNLDASILLFIQDNIRCGALDIIMKFFTALGDSGAIWLLFGIIFFFSRKYRKAGFDIIITVALCFAVNEILKRLLMRPRPFEVYKWLTVLIARPSSWSFPSGHSFVSFAAAYAYMCSIKKSGYIAYPVAALIALSRPYVGVHYPSDIVVGAILGTATAIIVYNFVNKLVKIPTHVPANASNDNSEDDDPPDK